jgi:hypothetical protein
LNLTYAKSAIIDLLKKAERIGALAQLTSRIRPSVEAETLRVFAQRMASLAVRRENPELLQLGLLAIGITSLRSLDVRDDLVVLAPLWRTAHIVTTDPRAEFAAAAAALPMAADFCEDWIARPADSQSLACMAYYESRDSDGFRYLYDPDTLLREVLERDFARRNPLIRLLLSPMRRRWYRETPGLRPWDSD